MERRAVLGGYRLSVSDRGSIENGCRAGFTFTAIATLIGKSTATVSREVGGKRRPAGVSGRGGPAGRRGAGAAAQADQAGANPVLRDRVEAGLEAYLSPEQIAGQLRREFPEDLEMQVHHETIYRELFVQGRGALRAELHQCLRSGRARRVTRAEARERAATAVATSRTWSTSSSATKRSRSPGARALGGRQADSTPWSSPRVSEAPGSFAHAGMQAARLSGSRPQR